MSDEKFVITKRDLSDPRIDEILLVEKAAKRPISASDRAPVNMGLMYNPIFYTGFAGFIGAFLAWAIIEPMIHRSKTSEEGIGLLLLFPVTSALIGFTVGLVEGIMSRNFTKALKCGLIGLGVGLAWGAIGTIIANIVFGTLLGVGAGLFPPQKGPEGKIVLGGGLLFMLMVARSVAWTVVGGGMGLGQGVALASKKMILNGIVGGVLGGFIGGLLFDPIGVIVDKFSPGASGAISRSVGLCVIGILVGMFLGIVESLSKQAWFIMKSGMLRGKQFIVYTNPMVIGSSPKCDIYLFKDPAVEPRHAEVKQLGSKFEVHDLKSSQGVFVNGTRVESKILEKGDIVVIGESILEFDQKVVG